ncbi:MAG: VOC family protein [Gammaproteobacteria bacterium]|nr:VOC family protein [Gammaproteobacteria bacterium]
MGSAALIDHDSLDRERVPRLAHHVLSISDPDASIVFYRECLGMTLVEQLQPRGRFGEEQRIFVGFAVGSELHQDRGERVCGQPFTVLELLHHGSSHPATAYRPSKKDGYWKVGVTVADVDLARRRLERAGVDVTEPFQFLDIGYLCHLSDPDGYIIELLQHDFEHNYRPSRSDPRHKLGSKPALGQITLRVKDPAVSLDFYQRLLGMRLLSRQVVKPHRFTLYFLASTGEQTPVADLDAVENREWLWRRPYTTLELQHVWGTEHGSFEYQQQTEGTTGFWGLGYVTPHLSTLLSKLESEAVPIEQPLGFDPGLLTNIAVVRDPDGVRVRLAEV